jgi:hypothetical protein
MNSAIAIVMLAVLQLTPVYAKKHFVLYGFKIGQTIESARNELGNPSKTIDFKDGFKAYVFMKGDHYVVMEADGSRPDMIWGIQIAGKSNPKNRGFGLVNLGDEADKTIKLLGKPDSTEFAVDEETKKELKHIKYYSYNKTSNYSLESENGKLTSMKIVFNGPVNPYPDFAFGNLTGSIKAGNLYRVCENISGELAVVEKGKTHRFTRSIVSDITSAGVLNDILFNKEYGIGTIIDSDIKNAALRLFANGTNGWVFSIEKKNRKYELFFMKSFEGWVLREITINK